MAITELSSTQYIADTEAEVAAAGVSFPFASQIYCIDSKKTLIKNIGGTYDISGGNMFLADNLAGLSNYATARNNLDIDSFKIKGFGAMGSAIIAESLCMTSDQISQATNLNDGQIQFFPVYLPIAKTVTGVKWHQFTQGVYTADNNNKVGLYSYDGAGTLTLVASSADDGTLWKAASLSLGSKAFSSPYAAVAGLYVIAILWNNSSSSTTPQIGGTGNAQTGMSGIDFTNSMSLCMTLAAQTDLPASQLSSGLTLSLGRRWVAVY